MGYVALIPVVPMAAFALLAPLPRRWRNPGRFVSVAAMTVSLVLSLIAFFEVWPGGHEEVAYHAFFEMGRAGGLSLGYGVRLDPVSAATLLVVTIVGLAVQVYSLGYMHRDERKGWYFAVLSLFTGAMLALTLADNFLMMFMAWEVMGLCSYLLIGFWHEQEAPRQASMKAFMTTRVGDIGFMLALAMMAAVFGTFDLEGVLGPAQAGTMSTVTATAMALFLLMGAAGKSAQVPLHVWLPDAMAGPTPASALIHAATMVAAGVYMVGRALPLFVHSGFALGVTLFIGSTTALLAGLVAVVQHDIKKVLAYSTISQLGYMIMALGAGNSVASLFHLVTHAFFKSLLFLGAGIIIHAAHTQDMRDMGGMLRRIPWTAATFTVGSLALAGVFPFSGFWSKDEILASLLHEHHYLAFAVGLLAAGVTAFYVSRMWFRVFTGETKRPDAREGHPEMIAPTVVLASVTVVIGWASPRFAEFLGHEGVWPEPAMALASTAVALAGIAAGWLVYGKRAVSTQALKDKAGYLYDALVQKLYFDSAYENLVVYPYVSLSQAMARFDMKVIDGAVNGAAALWKSISEAGRWFDVNVVDGAVNGVARAVQATGARVRRLQVGRVQTYQRAIAAAVVFLMALGWWAASWS
ncbi:MAG: NADH-quinone oxidoreductase subunit L [Coriobacteriia bacterium]